MPLIDKHPNGSFCWMELGTTDQNAAKNFYQSLFGWTSMDFPMGPSGMYTIFRLQDRDCAAAYTLMKEMLDAGVPPHWMVYLSTDNVDESTRKVEQLGGKVIKEPFDVGPQGRMSVATDPAGAHFCLWQEKQSPGIGIAGENNAFCWADLNVKNRDVARRFYEGLFGWQFVPGEGKDESTYLHIVNQGHGIGGTPPPELIPPGLPPHWMIYYQVADCDAASAKAAELGGRILVPPTPIPGTGKFSIVDDPQGAGFALFQLR